MNVGVVFDAGPAAYAGARIEFFRSLLETFSKVWEQFVDC